MAHGDKRIERWRELARMGKQVERCMLAEQAAVLEVFRGKGGLVLVELDAVTL